MHDATVPPPQSRPVHPYALAQNQALPFSALQQQHPSGAEVDLTEEVQAGRQEFTRESEVLSRGAGMRALAGHATADSTPGRSGSVGMGTFGKDLQNGQEMIGVSHPSRR